MGGESKVGEKEGERSVKKEENEENEGRRGRGKWWVRMEGGRENENRSGRMEEKRKYD